MEGKIEYIGNGIYVYKEYGGVWLLANSSVTPTDRIYLDPETWKALCNFMSSKGEEVTGQWRATR